MFLQVGAPIFAGVGFLFVALVLWVQGQRRHSLALQWLSLGQVAFALCAGLGAVYQLFHPHTFDLWSDLLIAALFLAVCASLVGLVYAIREAQRGSGLQR
jgi:protein-S-isoprenylcysteine O-methyltransferase Ste14